MILNKFWEWNNINENNDILLSFFINDLNNVVCYKTESFWDVIKRWNIQFLLWKIIYEIRNGIFMSWWFNNFIWFLGTCDLINGVDFNF